MAINVNPGSPIRHVATITSSGTWLAPAGTTLAFVSIHGASGGGGQGNAHVNRYGGQAGRAGGTGSISSGFVQVTPGASHVVTIGAGGGNSAAGGTTQFDGAITATGGGAGSTGSQGANGSGTAVTSLTTVPASASALARVFGNTVQNSGGSAGGSGGAVGPHSAGAPGASGAAGFVNIYI